MAISKVIYGNTTLIDLTSDTVASNKMLQGITAHDASGASISGSISSKAAQTYTPTTTDQTIASGQYLTGAQTIAGDANLLAANIVSGITIFGITGTGEAFTPLTTQEIWEAAEEGWGSVSPSYSAALWQAVAAGWSVSSTATDSQIAEAVALGWR